MVFTYTKILLVLPVWGWRWLLEFLPLQLADREVGWYER